MRKAVVAGQFYPADKKELKKQIELCFTNKLGPGSLPNPKAAKKTAVTGMIVPHAGYIFSGACAAHGYKALAETKKENLPETFILFGPNHTGYANALFSLSLEDFETPLGIVKNNTELGKKLIGCSAELKEDETAHKFEHSLEVQLPFLQYIYGLAKKEFSIVPIVISTNDFDRCVKMAKEISDEIKKMKTGVCMIASSDFTHYGPNYSFIPFNENIKQRLYALDRKAIEKILAFDAQGFYDLATKTTICGASGITILLQILRGLGIKKAELLKYYTSGDVMNDYENAVGYASIIFR
jgi:AmmeMemoRadiSam system protein B